MSFLLPQNATERRFAIGFAAIVVIAVGLLVWLGGDGWSAFTEKWMPVFAGDTEVRAKTIDFARGGTVFASVFAILSLVILWLTRCWWCLPFEEKKEHHRGAGKIFWIGLGAILVIATVVRAPRMTLSLYNDEIDTLQRYVAGGYPDVIKKADELLLTDEPHRFRPVSWTETAFGNRIGNNHSLYSIAARAIDDQHELDEVAFRLPALAGGLMSIAALGGIFVALGRPRVGLIAMLLLALHPWHVRFSTEARGYGLQMAFAALAVWCLLRAMRVGGWRWWLGFAVAQACCLWANAGALYFAIGLNVAVVALLIVRWIRSRESRLVGPWLVSNVLSAMAFFFAMAPLIPQLKAATKSHGTLQAGLPFGWWSDLPSLLFVGMPWFDGDASNPANPALTKWWGGVDVFMSAGFIAVVALALIGVISLIRSRSESGWLLVGAPILGILAATGVSQLTGATLLEWYLVWATIFVAAWLAAGVARICFDREGRASGWRRWAVYGGIIVFLLAAWKPLSLYRSHSKQALKNAVDLVQSSADDPITAFWWTEAAVYDPTMRVIFKPEQLAAIEARAEQEGRDLFFILGSRQKASAEQPTIVERLDGVRYEQLAELPGLEEAQFRTSVYRFLK